MIYAVLICTAATGRYEYYEPSGQFPDRAACIEASKHVQYMIEHARGYWHKSSRALRASRAPEWQEEKCSAVARSRPSTTRF
jgi:hypothetical protein